MNIEENRIFSAKLFIISIIPSFLLYRFAGFKIALTFLLIMLILSMCSLHNKNFAFLLKKKSDEIFRYLGNCISYTILSLIFIFVVIPTKFIMFLTKRDRLRRRTKNTDSYWIEYDNSEHNYELQY